MQGEFITIDYLSTFAGLVVVVALVVQFTKPIMKWIFKRQDEFFDEIIRIYVWFVAFVLQAFVIYVAGGFTAENVGLAAINSVPIAILAVGTYHCLQSAKIK